MRRVKMHDRDVNNSGRHGASRPKRDPRSHEFGLAEATPTFPSRLGDSARNVQPRRGARAVVCAPQRG